MKYQFNRHLPPAFAILANLCHNIMLGQTPFSQTVMTPFSPAVQKVLFNVYPNPIFLSKCQIQKLLNVSIDTDMPLGQNDAFGGSSATVRSFWTHKPKNVPAETITNLLCLEFYYYYYHIKVMQTSY
jgi:hypothetical protein